VIAGAFTTTKGALARVEFAWIIRAVSSLPEPAGPEMRMRELAGPTRSISRRRLAIADEAPTSCISPPAFERSSAISRRSRDASSARSTTRISRSALNGFSIKS
jgi:hypothetical protein